MADRSALQEQSVSRLIIAYMFGVFRDIIENLAAMTMQADVCMQADSRRRLTCDAARFRE
jgi:hypothetical protein